MGDFSVTEINKEIDASEETDATNDDVTKTKITCC
jgi:hypothetical protein